MITAAKLLLSTTLILAGIAKLQNPKLFIDSLQAFQLFPQMLIYPISQWIPTLEILTGILLFTKSFEGGALATCTLLFTSFTLLYIWAITNGLTLTCGCFGDNPFLSASLPIGLLRAMMLALLSAAAWKMSLRSRRV
jgi:hypothetical protein